MRKIRRKFDTISVRSVVTLVEDDALNQGSLLDLPTDKRLNEIIMDDIEYGVGNRPTLPACYDDDADVVNRVVDYKADIRYDPWDAVAEVCSISSVTPKETPSSVEVEPSVETE